MYNIKLMHIMFVQDTTQAYCYVRASVNRVRVRVGGSIEDRRETVGFG